MLTGLDSAVALLKSQGGQLGHGGKEAEATVLGYRCLCLCTSWLLSGQLGGEFSSRRTVRGTIESPLNRPVIMSHTSQAYMDYSLCGALTMMPGVPSVLFCYDVGCQWCVHFEERVKRGAPHLAMPSNCDLTVAIGKFHLSAHVESCFAQYSLNFIKGAAQVDGEVLETLWAPLNKSAPSTRSMSTSYRREMLDWQMNESNWQKMLKIGALKLPQPDIPLTAREIPPSACPGCKVLHGGRNQAAHG